MEFNHKSIKPFLVLISFGVILFWALQNLSLFGNIIGTLIGLCLPFLLGGCIAFVLNVPMRKIEALLFPKPNKVQKKLKRPVSLIVTLLILIALIAIVFGLVIPELSSSFTLLRDNVIRFLRNLEQDHPALLNESLSYLPSASELAALDTIV